MLKWFKRKLAGDLSDKPNKESLQKVDLGALRQEETAILFKHSRSCPVSWAANREVQSFASEHPSVPVYTLVVQEDRQLSREIAEWTGIRHESPQIMVFRRGAVVSTTSQRCRVRQCPVY